jgi:hypothetical protein
MKRFTLITTLFSISILAVWMIFQLWSAFQPSAKKENPPLGVQPIQNESMKAVDSGKEAFVPVTGVEARAVAPGPVYDASGRIVSLSPNGSSSEPVILVPAANVKIAPVYDSSGTLVSDPTGTIHATTNAKIAPVFDANGEVMSDPTGTLLNSNP